MSCQQVPTTPAFNPYPRSVQVGEFEVAIGGGIWVAIRAIGTMTYLDELTALHQHPDSVVNRVRTQICRGQFCVQFLACDWNFFTSSAG